jgi:hypothetical protein
MLCQMLDHNHRLVRKEGKVSIQIGIFSEAFEASIIIAFVNDFMSTLSVKRFISMHLTLTLGCTIRQKTFKSPVSQNSSIRVMLNTNPSA